jgi:formylglycine-generating enzyme required for sulfatase activity
MITWIKILTLGLVFGLLVTDCMVKAGEKPMPQWDGKESTAVYAKRAGLEPTLTMNLDGGVKLELVLIPAGKFIMGSPANEALRQDDETPHEVTIKRPFYMGKYTVTQEQYEKVMGKNPSQFKGAKNPVEMVSWNDAQDFCQKLSTSSGKIVRLPAEAEWEYACRAGSTTAYCFGDTENELALCGWYIKNNTHNGIIDGTTHPVGEKKPNAFGLYDMHGNVWEWCQDWLGSYPTGTVTDPTGPATGASRVLRGGSWRDPAAYCRAAFRDDGTSDGLVRHDGFRVVVGASKTP